MKQMIRDIFEEEALVIGGIVAVHGIDDGFIWRLMKNLDAIRVKALRRADANVTPDASASLAVQPNIKPHPAIEDFLLNIRRA
ncbi:MAG: hypothetical protein V1809_01805 [Planctomycetota bacterium]